jgi:hypothetical protein
MSTLPRPTGKELVRALERAGLPQNVRQDATVFSDIRMAAPLLFPCVAALLVWVY